MLKQYFPTPWGVLRLQSIDERLSHVSFTPQEAPQFASSPCPLLEEASRQLTAYFQQKLTTFDIPMTFKQGTPFQQKVWTALTKIPYGHVSTYGEIAHEVGLGKQGARAVGQANGKNPLWIFVPCHRVIAAGRKIGGYAGGLPMKEHLLALENIVL